MAPCHATCRPKPRCRAVALGCLCALLAFASGCADTLAGYASETALTIQQPATHTQSLDIPKRFFDEQLDARWQHHGIGIINDQATFLRMWDLYTIERTALPPSIDFETYALLFVYDPVYYNLVSIRGLNVWQGIANPIVERTTWTLSIEGDKKMREIRTKEGQILPEPKVNVAFLQIPRNRPGAPGVTAVLVEGKEDPAKSLVIPVPAGK